MGTEANLMRDQRTILNFPDFVRKKLSRLYASFKIMKVLSCFLFLTGITKFNKTSIFSELNTLTDISLSPRYGSLLGYTHEEVVEYFKDYLNRSAKASDINSEQLLDKLVFQYDGFCFEETVSKKFLLHGHFFPFSQSQKEALKTIGLKAVGAHMHCWNIWSPTPLGIQKNTGTWKALL